MTHPTKQQRLHEGTIDSTGKQCDNGDCWCWEEHQAAPIAPVSSNEITVSDMLEQARKWPRDGFGEGRWFHAIADENLAAPVQLRPAPL